MPIVLLEDLGPLAIVKALSRKTPGKVTFTLLKSAPC